MFKNVFALFFIFCKMRDKYDYCTNIKKNMKKIIIDKFYQFFNIRNWIHIFQTSPT